VVSLAWSIIKAADAVYFRSVVVALLADTMVKTVDGQAYSCDATNISMIRLRRMKWVEHVACMGRLRDAAHNSISSIPC
jgi:hypothetical protein